MLTMVQLVLWKKYGEMENCNICMKAMGESSLLIKKGGEA